MENRNFERIIKAIINYNKQQMDWDKNFLKYQDYFDLVIIETDTTITLTTKMKK